MKWFNDPQKIVSYYTRMKSLEQKEWRFKNYCKMWELRAAEYAVIKKIEEDDVSPESAPFPVKCVSAHLKIDLVHFTISTGQCA